MVFVCKSTIPKTTGKFKYFLWREHSHLNHRSSHKRVAMDTVQQEQEQRREQERAVIEKNIQEIDEMADGPVKDERMKLWDAMRIKYLRDHDIVPYPIEYTFCYGAKLQDIVVGVMEVGNSLDMDFTKIEW